MSARQLEQQPYGNSCEKIRLGLARESEVINILGLSTLPTYLEKLKHIVEYNDLIEV